VTKTYRTVVADPPWRYTGKPHEEYEVRRNGRRNAVIAEGHYPTMEVSQIAALPVAELAADEAHLYLWVTNPILTQQRTDLDPMEVVRRWGFEAKALLTWVKTGAPGMGWYWRGMTEHVVFAVRGDLGIPSHLREHNVFTAPRRDHSQKPDSFMDMVERVSPPEYLELFARRQRIGWSTWGDEALEHVQVADG